MNITITQKDGTAKDQRTFYAREVRAALEDEKRAAITAGCYLLLGKATFTQDEKDAWTKWATEVTRKSIKTVDSYIAVGRAYSGSTKDLQGKIKDWTFEALQAYATVEEADRKAVVAAVRAEDSNPSPELVRAARDNARDEKLTPAERTQKERDKKKRDKARAEDKTAALVKDISPLLNKVGTDEATWKVLMVGYAIGRAHASTDEKIVESALKLYRDQKLAAIAKRASKTS